MDADILEVDAEYAGFDWEAEEAAEVAGVDEGLSVSDVVGRIEELVAEIVQGIACGKCPTLELVSRAKANRMQQPAELADDGQEELGASNCVVALGGRLQTRSLTANQGGGAFAYARVFIVLKAVHEMLTSGVSSTQRDLYYKLQQPPLLSTPAAVDSAVLDVVSLLRVPRSNLGITCASKGSVAGRLFIRDTPTSAWIDCTNCGNGGKAIPGDISAISAMSFQCSARYLVVVEKDAVFQRLAQDRVWDAVPCVMVTAKGMPDLATRAFCAALQARFPTLTPVGLVDYNPSGIIILRTYRCGSHRMGLESPKYALPGLKWLGLRSGWLVDVESQHMQRLSKRDQSLLPGLKASLHYKPRAVSAQGTAPASHDAAGRRRMAGHKRRAPGLDAADSQDQTQDPWDYLQTSQDTTQESAASESESSEDTDSEDQGDEDEGSRDPWLGELEVMEAMGYKADIESVYSVVGYGGLKDMVVSSICKGDYI